MRVLEAAFCLSLVLFIASTALSLRLSADRAVERQEAAQAEAHRRASKKWTPPVRSTSGAKNKEDESKNRSNGADIHDRIETPFERNRPQTRLPHSSRTTQTTPTKPQRIRSPEFFDLIAEDAQSETAVIAKMQAEIQQARAGLANSLLGTGEDEEEALSRLGDISRRMTEPATAAIQTVSEEQPRLTSASEIPTLSATPEIIQSLADKNRIHDAAALLGTLKDPEVAKLLSGMSDQGLAEKLLQQVLSIKNDNGLSALPQE